MNRLKKIIGIGLLISSLSDTAGAQDRRNGQSLPEIELACKLEHGALTANGDLVVVLLKLPQNSEGTRCAMTHLLATRKLDDLVLITDQSQVGSALQEREKAMIARRLSPERKAKVGRLIAAIKIHDRIALESEIGTAVPYFLGYDEPKPSSPSPFNIDSIAGLASCTLGTPHSGGVDWFTVQWDCPADVSSPWPSTATSFKFDGLRVVKIQTTPGAPLLSVPNR